MLPDYLRSGFIDTSQSIANYSRPGMYRAGSLPGFVYGANQPRAGYIGSGIPSGPDQVFGNGYAYNGPDNRPDFVSIDNTSQLQPTAYSAQAGGGALTAQPLDAFGWNAARDARQMQANRAAAAVPAPYQASYYGGQQGGTDSVYTGHGSTKVNSFAPSLLASITQRYFGGGPATYGYSSNPDGTPFFHLNGQDMSDAMAADQPGSGLSEQDWIKQAVKMAGGQTKSPEDRINSFLNSPEYNNPSYNGAQRAELFQQVVGQDPISYQKNQTDQKLKALELLSKQQEMGKGALDVYSAGAKTFGADDPEQIKTTYNTDPSHPNQFLLPEKFQYDPLDSTKIIGKQPARWVYAQPEDVNAWIQSAPQGYSRTLSAAQIVQQQRDVARGKELLAKSGGGPMMALGAGGGTPVQGFGASDQSGAVPAGIAARHFLGTSLPEMLARANGRIDNASTSVMNGGINTANFLSQLFTGNPQAPIQPYAYPYDPNRPVDARWGNVNGIVNW